jgi:hypothetical protein
MYVASKDGAPKRRDLNAELTGLDAIPAFQQCPAANGNRRLLVEDNRKFLGRGEAAQYLKNKYGFGATQTLAKLACIGGGPIFQKYGRHPVYTQENLDAWAAARMSGPLTNTSVTRASCTSLLANATATAIGAAA